mgnify:CR=1 FL=1|tara:strand:+ start:1382 stop:1936 length:555 start_codon:yes stop_codon:yes gene_type:complete
MGFLDNIKDVPQNNGGNYMKLNQGPNQIRIVGASDDGGLIQGMIGWGTTAEGGRKPYRWKIGEDIPDGVEDKPKQFWAIIVWNYKEKKIQILELTQSKLRQGILILANDDEWGDPRKYDLKIVKTGEGLETKYELTPSPHKKRGDEINAAVKDMKINLEALYTGDDPFAELSPEPEDDTEEGPF